MVLPNKIGLPPYCSSSSAGFVQVDLIIRQGETPLTNFTLPQFLITRKARIWLAKAEGRGFDYRDARIDVLLMNPKKMRVNSKVKFQLRIITDHLMKNEKYIHE